MKKIFSVFKLDLKSITKNLIIFVVVIGITILPALYAWFNIAANWDPYSNTGELPFAVYSADEGCLFKSMTINAGEKIIDKVKENKSMGWDLVDSEEDAVNGVKDGKYYAAIVVPKDFSNNLISIATGEFKQAKLQYYVNQKTNAISAKITNAGMNLIESSIDSTYVSVVAEAIAAALNITTEELEQNKDTLADKLTSALDNAKTDIDSAKKSIDLLISTLDSIDQLIKINQDMLPEIQSSLSKAGVVAGDIKSALQSAQSTTSQLSTSISDLINSGDAYMESVSTSINEACSTVSGDSEAIANKFLKIKTLNEKKQALNNRLISVFETIQDSTGIDCSKAIDILNKDNEKQQAIIDKVVSISDNVKKTGKIPENAKTELDNLVSDANAQVQSIKTEYSSLKTKLDGALDKAYSTLDSVADFAQTIDLEDGSLNSAFTAGSNSIADLKEVLNNLKSLFDKLNEKIDKTIANIKTLKDSDTLESMLLPIIENPKALGEYISAPVSYDTNEIYPIKNYGSAMTPFYSSLALWVGGIVLVAVINVDLSEKDRKKLGKANSTQLFFGRYIIFFIIGQIQALIIALGDLYFLKIQCDNPLLFILTCLISSFVYTLFIYSLTITFSVIGKALAVIILVIQIAGAGGTFPIEVLPGPFKALSPFMPFKYGINALRETVAGVDTQAYLKYVGILLLFIIPALVLGLLLRKPCIKAIKFFNEKIEKSDLVI